jgi:hypothetical protein
VKRPCKSSKPANSGSRNRWRDLLLRTSRGDWIRTSDLTVPKRPLCRYKNAPKQVAVNTLDGLDRFASRRDPWQRNANNGGTSRTKRYPKRYPIRAAANHFLTSYAFGCRVRFVRTLAEADGWFRTSKAGEQLATHKRRHSLASAEMQLRSM